MSVIRKVLVAVAVSAVALGAQQSGDALLVRGGTLIDGTGAPPKPNTSILIRNGRIERIGANIAADGARVIDATGKFVLPGLIDSHIHYNGWDATLYPYWGVTTVFDLGNLTEWVMAQRQATAEGRIPGARLFSSGNHINGPPQAGEPILAADFAGWIHIVTDRESTLAALNTLEAHGANALKVHYRLNDESLRTIVEFSREHDIPIVGHTKDAVEAANMGIRFIEHLDPVVHATSADPEHAEARDMDPATFDRVIDVLVEKQVMVNPALVVPYLAVAQKREIYLAQDRDMHPKLSSVPQFLKDRWIAQYTVDPKRAAEMRADVEKSAAFLRRFVEKGGMVLSGSNAGRAAYPGRTLHREMQVLVDAGLTPMEVIKATTLYPARFYGKEADLGTVEVGKKGDLLLVDGDPLADISNTEKISAVVLEGRIVDRTLAFKNPFPRPVSDEPTPVIESMLPFSFVEGQTSRVLTLKGKYFDANSVVQVAGRDVAATREGKDVLKVIVPPDLATTIGTYPVVVTNPLPGGGSSNQRHFFVSFKPRPAGRS